MNKTGLVVIALCTQLAAVGEIKETKLSGFTIEQEIVLPGSPAEVYDAVTGDISPWWDHHFTATPKKLYIEPRPGGGFYEIFNDAGEGALHATVIYAERGKRLRYTGQLPDGVEKIVDSVWHHMLVEQLKPYLESPEYKKRKGPR